MNTHEINKPQAETFGIACNPLTDTYHEIQIDGSHVMTTGQPVVIYGATKAEVYDQLFSEWTLDADGNLDTYTAYEGSLSIDYTEADAEQTSADAMEIIDGLMIRPIKHPDREEWAMVVSQQVLGRAVDGAKKDALLVKHGQKVAGGKNKTKAEAVADGWHRGR